VTDAELELKVPAGVKEVHPLGEMGPGDGGKK
jgi:hypothetical protein